MPHPRFSNEEITRRGEEIYAGRLRAQLEPSYLDKLAKHPGATIYGLRVGAPYMYEFGGGLIQIKQ